MKGALALGLCLIAGGARATADVVRGLPFTRSYPLEEIGNVPRGARLSFDAFGRLALIQEGVYAVLNDTNWVDLAEGTGTIGMTNVVPGEDGHTYYGSRGSWGTVQRTADGHLRPIPLVPAAPPAWTATTSFEHIISTDAGVYFAGVNGVVFWDFTQRQNRFFDRPGIAGIFRVGDRVYASSHGGPLQYVDGEAGVLRDLPGIAFGGAAVDLATKLDETHTLIYVRDGRLLVFDGETISPWEGQSRNGLTGMVTGLLHLVDGGTAIAITGKGLFLLSPEGEVISALTTPEYHRVTGLAAREPGVLWVAVEDAIEKVLYRSPVTTFGQRLGLPISWPLLLQWNDRTIVASSGKLYQAVEGPPGAPSHFELMPQQLESGVWAGASDGRRLLLGNVTGVYEAEPDGRLTRVAELKDVMRLALVGTDLCFVLGRTEITVLRWADGQWSECAPRIPGVGVPIVVHAGKQSVWIESGVSKVTRVALEEGRLKAQTFADMPWAETQWTNVGIVGDTVVLSGAKRGGRVFFDERTQARCEAPRLEALLDRSPHWITRIMADEAGTLWGTHSQGVVTFTPKGGEYEIDASTFDLVNDLYPFVAVLPGNDVWFTGSRSLHHVEPRGRGERRRVLQPMLVSVTDGRTNGELFDGRSSRPTPLQLRYEQNNLSFRLFSGGYAWRRAPRYEFRLNSGDRWTALGSGSVLNFSGLSEGAYNLELRVAESQDPLARPVAFSFEIFPPWHRTWLAYTLYGVGLLLALAATVRWSSQRTRKRNAVLERLVRDSTTQLKVAMEKLNEETRNAATLAERDRLAGEIHDSLQQGLSGLMLQLDATLKLPSLAADVRSRLSVARNMVSFTRQEVQHAVWDMESPLLADTELGEALRKLTALINSGVAQMDVAVSGSPCVLPSGTKHHLLRIAQEAITNAVRHASTQRITIELTYRPEMVSLSISDNGVGFRPKEVMSETVGHFGLRGLRGRAAKIGGELLIQSSPGTGTMIRVVVPLPTPVHPVLHASTTAL